MRVLIILLLNLIYLPAIKYGLVSDDGAEMKMFPYKHIKWSKLFSILTHIAVAEFIYIAFGANSVSLWASLLFSVHPSTVQVTCWRAGRHYGFNALIFLLILWCPYLFPLYFVSIFGIGTTVFTPLIFLTIPQYWFVALVILVLAHKGYDQITANVKSKKKGTVFGPDLPDEFVLYRFSWDKIIIAIKTFGYYVLSAILPIKNGLFNSFLTTLGSSESQTRYWYSLNRHFWGGILAIVTMSVIWFFNIHNNIGRGIMLFVLTIIPFLNFITVQQFTASRYLYSALIGMQIALAGLLVQLGIPGYCILSALWLYYFDKMIKVRRIYQKNDRDMIFLDSQEFPDNPKVWYYRYEYMLHKNNSIMAFAEATYGLKFLPQDCQLWFGLSCAAFELGDLNASSEFLKNSEKNMILAERKNMQSLIEEMKMRIKLKLEGKWNPNMKRRF